MTMTLAENLYWKSIHFDHHAKWWTDAFCFYRKYGIAIGDRDTILPVEGYWISPQKCKKNFHLLGRCGIDLRLVRNITYSFVGNIITLIDGSKLYWDHWRISPYL